MGKIKISDSIMENGYMGNKIGIDIIKSINVSSKTFVEHKPYAKDWKEARERVLQKINDEKNKEEDYV